MMWEMPKNLLIRIGVLLIVGSALVWAGYQLARLSEWILPWTAGLGVILLIVGVIVEMQNAKKRGESVTSALHGGERVKNTTSDKERVE